MSAETNDSANNAQGMFIYMGPDSVIPRDVTRVRLHPSARVIATKAFYGCYKLVEVELCEGLEEIGKYAFFRCVSLKGITIPSSLRVIDRRAFHGCTGLVEVELCGGIKEIGDAVFCDCKSLKRITLPSSLRRIGQNAFAGCHELVEVELSEGLEEIGDAALYDCKSLKRMTIPSSVRVIGGKAFSQCDGLVEVELCEGLQEIESGAFSYCKSLKRITIPSSVRRVAMLAFWGCVELLGVELCEGIQEIGNGAFSNCPFLRNIAIPSTCQVGSGVFEGASTLTKAFPSVSNSVAISEALKHRFDELPIHQLCYYQQYHPPNDMLRHLRETMGTPEQPNITGIQQDCLGMTPLHILACYTKHDMDLFQYLIEKYPNNLTTEDTWEALPILYAFWGNAPWEVVQLLVECHKTYFPDHALDWGSMVVTLGEANEPDGIQNLFDTQQNYFSDQDINWEECAVELARSQSTSIGRCTSIGTFQLLLRLGVANRLGALGVGKWQNKLEKMINECPDDRKAREERVRLLYSNLASFEQLKEATWLLELAVWKAKIDESTSNIHGRGGEERNQCRINCGVQQILPIVVSFLSPNL